MKALHKKTNKLILDKPAVEVYNNYCQWGRPRPDASVETRICGKEVGTDACALCHPRGTLILQAVGAYCARLCGLMGRVSRVYTAFSPSFARQTMVFLYPFFSSYRKEMSAMTMPKRETTSVWSKVREDRDIDDLIFDYEAYHAGDDDSSDR